MSKRSRKSKRRLNSLLWMVVLTGMLLLFSTYAWFSANRVVSIDGIHAKVAAAEGLQISLDGATWSSSISDLAASLEAITSKSVNNWMWPTDLRPVSTNGQVDASDAEMAMYSGDLSADGTYLIDPVKNQTDYAVFDLYFKNSSSNSVGDTLQLGTGTKLTVENENTGLESSVRLGMLVYSDDPQEFTTGQSTLNSLKAKTTSKSVIWEPNYNAHIAEVVTNDARINSATDEFKTLTLKSITTSKASDGTEGVLANINVKTVSEDSVGNLDETSTLRTIGTLDTDTNLTDTSGNTITLPANKIVKTRIYIYLEGQDPDCIDTATMGSQLNFYLSFTKPAVESGS